MTERATTPAETIAAMNQLDNPDEAIASAAEAVLNKRLRELGLMDEDGKLVGAPARDDNAREHPTNYELAPAASPTTHETTHEYEQPEVSPEVEDFEAWADGDESSGAGWAITHEQIERIYERESMRTSRGGSRSHLPDDWMPGEPRLDNGPGPMYAGDAAAALRQTVRVLPGGRVARGIRVPHRAANIRATDARVLAAPPRVSHTKLRFAPALVPAGVDQRTTTPHDCRNHIREFEDDTARMSREAIECPN